MKNSERFIRDLPRRLALTNSEEEVKNEFCKAFGVTLDASHGIDLYTQEVLYEFKYDKNLQNVMQRSRVIAQLLYYVYRLINNRNDTRLIPSYLCGIDKNEAFIVETDKYERVCSNRSFDWDRAPSTPDPEMVNAVSRYKETKDAYVYSFSISEDYDNFVNKLNSSHENYQLSLFAERSLKKIISEDTFSAAFELWCSLFEDYVRNGTKPSEYFLADIRSGTSHMLAGGQVGFELTPDNIRRKPMPMSKYEHFWNTYEKCQDARTVISIRQKMDRLTKEDLRRFTGEFYTPIDFARKAIDYIEREVGNRWWEQGYRLWDMAAGSGNLIYELPEEALRYCYISTLLVTNISITSNKNKLFFVTSVY